MARKHLFIALLVLFANALAQSDDELHIPVENDNQFPPDNNSELDLPEGSGANAIEEPLEATIDTTKSPVPLFEDVQASSILVNNDTEPKNVENVCPTVCVCNIEGNSNKYIVDCANGDLAELPQPIDSKTTELNLQNNKLTEIPQAISQLKNLKVLNLQNNQIMDIKAGSISELPELTSLKLGNNRLIEYPIDLKNSFGLTKLEELDLGGNDMRTVLTPETFSTFKALKKITLPSAAAELAEDLCASLKDSLQSVCIGSCSEKSFDCPDAPHTITGDGDNLMDFSLPGLLSVDQEPEDTDPAINKPENIEHAISKPEDIVPAKTKSVDIDPGMSKSEDIDPAISKPENIDPVISKPEDINPALSKPEDIDPAKTKSVDIDPGMSKPEDIDPAISKPENIDPVISKPEDIDPALSKPEDPVISKPEDSTINKSDVTDPAIIKPESISPVTNKSEELDPVISKSDNLDTTTKSDVSTDTTKQDDKEITQATNVEISLNPTVTNPTTSTTAPAVEEPSFRSAVMQASDDASKPVVDTKGAKTEHNDKVTGKSEDGVVGAATSTTKTGGVDTSIIAVVVAGMVLIVAGITIKKNWSSIRNRFSSSPRNANDRTNGVAHNGTTPEEVPLQEKSPV